MDSGSLLLVVGLGNPGREYAGTRHNVGFDVVDELVHRLSGRWEENRKWRAVTFREGGVLYLKPLTFMNLSGEAVRKAADFYKIPLERVLVVYDEMSLPLGRFRLRKSGSAAGHNGIRSVMEMFGSEAVPRLRVGIGQSGLGGAVGYVLGRFSPAEMALVGEVVRIAADAVTAVTEQGFDLAMNRYNALRIDCEE